ncbi:MAG: D-aminoacyl-tRNA deacylase [Candidatus Binatia bacterium]
MRLVIQRVSQAHVTVGESIVGSIGAGICLFIGVKKGDGKANVGRLTKKVTHLRIFEDEQGKMNRSLIDVHGEILVVSEFTLYGDCAKGHRPSFSDAAPGPEAESVYNYFVATLGQAGLKVATGVFGAKMEVAINNDGPVTLILED